ncbi:uncharacterized protein LOC135811381 [Sycon ciliatum]|uniref:uncharacterized protein LOC135811381 n=1 Tax=Sycon ciliatum TaxID=27933 RepID=UPI0031F6B3E1
MDWLATVFILWTGALTLISGAKVNAPSVSPPLSALSAACSGRNPCQNGGTCQTIGRTGYRCRCAYLFRGRQCQTYWLQDEVLRISSEMRGLRKRLATVEDANMQCGAQHALTLSTFMASLQSKVDKSLSSQQASLDTRLDEMDKLSLRLGQDVLSSLPTSCKDLQNARRNVSLPSGLYKIVSSEGRIIEDRSSDAFGKRANLPLSSYYVDGVSVTRGSPMHHLWSYAAGFDDFHDHSWHCPCSSSPGHQPQKFVGHHYYCAYLGSVYRRWTFSPANHAWSNTSQCTAGGTCCDNRDMPWFHRQLGATTSDKVQIRICSDQDTGNEDVGIDEAAIFVK